MNRSKTIIIICAVIMAVCAMVLIFLFMRRNKKNESRSGTPGGGPKIIEKGNLPDKLPHREYFIYISGSDHRTDMYQFRRNDIFVARRGMTFKITNKKINLQNVAVKITQIVNEYRATNDLRSTQPENIEQERLINYKSTWNTLPIDTDSVRVDSRTAGEITFVSDVDASIGKYSIKIGKTEIVLYLLFNPYHSGDGVYFPQEELLDEYLLNQNGFVFKGELSKPDYMLWNYSQFEEKVFLGVMSLITYLEGYKEYDGRDPASVARNLTFGIPNNIATGYWATNPDISWHQEPDSKWPNQFQVCNRPSDCDPINNVCQQPYFKNDPDYKLPKVCGYAVPDTEGGTKKLSDYIPPTQSDLYKACRTDGDCDSVDLELPDFYQGDYQKKCIKALSCGHDAYSPDINNLYSVMKKIFTADGDQENIDLSNEAWNHKYDREKSGSALDQQRRAVLDFFYTLPEETRNRVFSRYVPSKSPYFWSSSLQIFNIYLEALIKSDYKVLQHVSYVQCWVFGALTTSSCRALGIPCRQLAVYLAFHEKCNYPEKCFDSATSPYSRKYVPNENPSLSNGSIWTFHNWNDVWMRRSDLSEPEYSKPQWQAIDSTPQELSVGVNQLGPAPLSAVLAKDNINFDTSFVTSEVNYEAVIKGENVQQHVLAVSSVPLSTNIIDNPNLTLGDIQLDITKEYVRIPANSLAAALKPVGNSVALYVNSSGVSNPIEAQINFSPISSGKIDYTVEGYNITYRGGIIDGGPVFSHSGSLDSSANKNSSVYKNFDVRKVNTNFSQYFKFFVNSTFPDGKKMVASQTTYLQNPKIDVRMDGVITKNKKYTITAVMRNPYAHMALENCELHIHSQGVLDDKIKIPNLGPSEAMSQKYEFSLTGIPNFKNSSVILTLAASNVFENFHGYKFIRFA